MILQKDELQKYIDTNGLSSKNRQRELVYKRAIISRVLVSHGLTLTDTGRMFNRDHATVIHYLKVYDEMIKYDDFKMLDYFVHNDLLKFIDFEKAEQAENAPDFSQLTPIEFKLLGANTMKDFRKIKDEVVNKSLSL